MNLFSYIFPRVIATSHSRYNKTIRVIERFGKNELHVDGIQQSGPYTIRLWKTGLKDLFDKSPEEIKNILVLGVGGGTLFGMLKMQFPHAHITAVDVDATIISLYKKYFMRGDSSSVSLVCEDARKFAVEATSRKQTFDLIIVDCYIGNDVPEFVINTAFLASIYRILAVKGMVVYNYFSFKNQPHNAQVLLDKLSQIYHCVYSKDILRNIFFYCQ